MFNKDFFPTPDNVIIQMLEGYDIQGKVVLEPSAGKGDIVDFCISSGVASIIACEKNKDLQKILTPKCKLIAEDFLTVKSEDVSHIDLIIMNPPFSADEKHILHAWEIAPAGCDIIALCNLSTVKNYYYSSREILRTIIDENGKYEDLGDCFSQAERKTGVEVALIKIKKPGQSYENEFEGFFLDEDPTEQQYNGIMPYNFVRDLVNRYVAAVKIFDEQLEAAGKMNALTESFYSSNIAMSITEKDKPKSRNEFKKDLQKSAWKYIFNKMNMQKYATKGLREDINRFVEKQVGIPFTMKNIYRMLEIVIGTQDQRIDKSILEVFDKLTSYYHENRYNLEGWKTNSHYLINQKFILPYMCEPSWTKGVDAKYYGGNSEIVEDLLKALCFITGENFDKLKRLQDLKGLDPNKWYDWNFFEVKAFKKGTIHFKFKDEKSWALFNQRVAKLKGFTLPETIKKAA